MSAAAAAAAGAAVPAAGAGAAGAGAAAAGAAAAAAAQTTEKWRICHTIRDGKGAYAGVSHKKATQAENRSGIRQYFYNKEAKCSVCV